MRYLLCLLLLAVCAGISSGQCRNGRCVLPVSRQIETLVEAHWRIYPNNPGQAFLHKGEECLGGYDFAADVFRAYVGGAWGEPTSPPVTQPAVGVTFGQVSKELPTGVDPKSLQQGEKYSKNGELITRSQAIKLIKHSATTLLPDDAGLRHLTVIARDAIRASRAKREIAGKDLAELVKPFRVQVYDTSRQIDKAILSPFQIDADPDFKQEGELWMMQEAEKDGKGKVIFAIYGQPELSQLTEALRKADPNYKPGKKPAPVDPKPAPAPAPSTPNSNAGSTAFMGTATLTGLTSGFLYFKRRRHVVR